MGLPTAIWSVIAEVGLRIVQGLFRRKDETDEWKRRVDARIAELEARGADAATLRKEYAKISEDLKKPETPGTEPGATTHGG